MNEFDASITLSIVSHGHAAMLAGLLAEVAVIPAVAEVIVTVNVPEPLVVVPGNLTGRIRWRRNVNPQGFGANHNAAFAGCKTPYFCVLNPDISLQPNPFPLLLQCLDDSGAALAAPQTQAPDGSEQDSIRKFPTPLGLALKALGGAKGAYVMQPGQGYFFPDWVGGMFMLFRSDAFKRIGGFDERFYLYYEDVDICARLWKAGLRVAACPQASVVHAAQRASHRDARHLRWHLASMARYFWKHYGRLPKTAGAGA